MADVTINVPYSVNGKDLPVTITIPRDKLQFDGSGTVTGGDEDFIIKAAEQVARNNYPKEFGSNKPSVLYKKQGNTLTGRESWQPGPSKALPDWVAPYQYPDPNDQTPAWRRMLGYGEDAANILMLTAAPYAIPAMGLKTIAPVAAGTGASYLADKLGAPPEVSGAVGYAAGGLTASPKLSGAAVGAFKGAKLFGSLEEPNPVMQKIGGLLGMLGGGALGENAKIPYGTGYAGMQLGSELAGKVHPIAWTKGAISGAMAGAKNKPWWPGKAIGPQDQGKPSAAISTQRFEPHQEKYAHPGTGVWEDTTPAAGSATHTTPPPILKQLPSGEPNALPAARALPQLPAGKAPIVTPPPAVIPPLPVTFPAAGNVVESGPPATYGRGVTALIVKPPEKIVAAPAASAPDAQPKITESVKTTPKVTVELPVKAAAQATVNKPSVTDLVKQQLERTAAKSKALNPEIPPERQAPTVIARQPSVIETRTLQNQIMSVVKNDVEVSADKAARELGVGLDQVQKAINGMISTGEMTRQGNKIFVVKEATPIVNKPATKEEFNSAKAEEDKALDKLTRTEESPDASIEERRIAREAYNDAANKNVEVSARYPGENPDVTSIKKTPKVKSSMDLAREALEGKKNAEVQSEETKKALSDKSNAKDKETELQDPKTTYAEDVKRGQLTKEEYENAKKLEEDRVESADSLAQRVFNAENPDPKDVQKLRDLHDRLPELSPDTVNWQEIGTIARAHGTTGTAMHRVLTDMGVKVEPSKIEAGYKYGISTPRKLQSNTIATHRGLLAESDQIMKELDLLGKKPNDFTDKKGSWTKQIRDQVKKK